VCVCVFYHNIYHYVTFSDSLFNLHYSKTSVYSFYDLSTVGAMYVIQETEAPCINISDTNSNHELEKLLDRIKYVARSCKEILDKYQVYEGMVFLLLFFMFYLKAV